MLSFEKALLGFIFAALGITTGIIFFQRNVWIFAVFSVVIVVLFMLKTLLLPQKSVQRDDWPGGRQTLPEEYWDQWHPWIHLTSFMVGLLAIVCVCLALPPGAINNPLAVGAIPPASFILGMAILTHNMTLKTKFYFKITKYY